MQSRKQSAVETVTGTVLGFAGSWVISYVSVMTIPHLPTAVTVATLGCTVWSLVRGYSVRRYFARRHGG